MSAARPRWMRIARRVWMMVGLILTAAMFYGFQAADVEVTGLIADERAFRFAPVAPVQDAQLIFLPGAMVEPSAYVPLLRRVAGAGFAVTLIKLPWRTAWSDQQRRELFDEVQNRTVHGKWVLAGHSRGAMLAARFVHERPRHPGGLVLLGTTHPRDFDLSEVPLPVTKVIGTADGVAPLADARANRHLLPASTTWIEIDGGNHVQFGNYRFQLGDHMARISRDSQQQIAARALIDALKAAAP